MKSIAVVGGSLAGIEAARTLREEGFAGRLTVLAEEPDEPYDRPPLSKGFLDGSLEAGDLALPAVADLDLRPSTRAVSLQPAERMVLTAAGDAVRADAIVLATGARARRLPTRLGPAEGVHVLRTLADATALRLDLVPGRRLVVVGGGFIGAEVAATARTLGLDVTIVEPQPRLLHAQLGPLLSATLAEAHRARGVHLVTGATVAELVGGERVRAVRLADGARLPADVVVIGIGSEPTIEWLRGSGVALGDGVLADERGRTNLPGVVAVGDCAAWRGVGSGGDASNQRRQHWTAALRQAAIAARALLDRFAEPAPTDLDYVWSDQYDLRLQIVGRPHPSLTCVPISGTHEEPPFTVGFADHQGVLRSVVSVNEARAFAKWRRRVGRPCSELAEA